MKTITCALVLTVLGAANLAAHYTYIVPQQFRVASGDTVVIGFHSGDGFPESTAILKRIQEPAIHTPQGRLPIVGFKEDGKRLAAAINVAHTGHVIVTAVNATAIEDMKPAEFEQYLTEEGLGHIVAARKERGEVEKPGKERYTMYAKTILLSGAPGDGYRIPVGLPLEIVPEKDPYSLRSGEALPVRVLLRGAPAPNLEVRATSVAGKPVVVGTTDAQGRVTVPVSTGPWRLHTIHMERAVGDVDWESLWTTLTFEVS
jgi:uncharacterized GH25 family protein